MVHRMKQRIKTAVLLIAAVLPMFFFRNYALMIITIACALASKEITALITDQYKWLLFILFFSFLIVFSFEIIPQQISLIGGLLILLALASVMLEGVNFKDLSVAMFITVLLAIAIHALLKIYDKGIPLLFFVFLTTFGADTGAYFIGSQFGKTKLIERISPNKTVEGFVGGVLSSLALGTLYSYFMLPMYQLTTMVMISLCMPFITQLGDLVFSQIKRTYGIKDFGDTFPGHGGALDRIDSLIFGLLLMALFINGGLI